ncbi:uncharacterized protein LOC116105068 [Pistacia vera]|uniref:uncharacterized protein LOC116105068 n=1 Tax=Pistacia vera TaxID=55513 RepID=UPI00126358CE|nr:uncharacterized protein LOC116105068 [Pistacia vera]
MSVENAFKIIEMETAFTFDLLYTKAPLLYTPWGLFLHFVTFFLTFLVLLIFVFLALNHKHNYSKIDLFVTFGLLIGAIVLEIYAALVLLSSDRAVVWFWKHNKTSTWHIPSCFQPSKGPRWSNKMAQYSLLSFSMKEKTHLCLKILKTLRCLKILSLFNIDKMLEESLYVTYEEVPEELKKLIFQNLKDKAAKRTRVTENQATQVEEPTSSRKSEGIPNFGEDLSKRILFWHFITEISYYMDKSHIKSDPNIHFRKYPNSNSKLMKKISRYMMYLLVIHPSLLSIGMSAISFEDEVDTLVDTFQTMRSEGKKGRNEMLTYLDEHGLGDNKKGVLRDAYSFMKRMNEPDQKIKLWDEIGCSWLELLAYAARKCKGSLHAQNLRFGGELLTHVWLLMAQFGLTEHFQTSEKLHIARLVSE